MFSQKIVYMKNENFIEFWPASIELAFDLFYNFPFGFSPQTIEELLILLRPDNQKLLLSKNDMESHKNPLKAKNYIYCLDHFVKKNNKFYFYNYKTRAHISLKDITLKSFICSYINFILKDSSKKKIFTVTFCESMFKFFSKLDFQISLLELLNKNNSFKQAPKKFISGCIVFFDNPVFEMSHKNKKTYTKIFKFLEISENKFEKLVALCISQNNYSAIILDLKKYKLKF